MLKNVQFRAVLVPKWAANFTAHDRILLIGQKIATAASINALIF